MLNEIELSTDLTINVLIKTGYIIGSLPHSPEELTLSPFTHFYKNRVWSFYKTNEMFSLVICSTLFTNLFVG